LKKFRDAPELFWRVTIIPIMDLVTSQKLMCPLVVLESGGCLLPPKMAGAPSMDDPTSGMDTTRSGIPIVRPNRLLLQLSPLLMSSPLLRLLLLLLLRLCPQLARTKWFNLWWLTLLMQLTLPLKILLFNLWMNDVLGVGLPPKVPIQPIPSLILAYPPLNEAQ
jgi:hypothetical protein